MSFLHRPQHIWLRKALFQIHLWTGLILGLYMLVIGATGSILVFEQEWVRLSYPRTVTVPGRSEAAHALIPVIDALHRAYPRAQVQRVYLPSPLELDSTGYLKASTGRTLKIVVDTSTKTVVHDSYPTWLASIRSLHINLLMGLPGRYINGIGACFLLVLCLSGVVIWWPGVKRWKRSLGVNLRGKWKRINWDLHGAVGIWTLSLLTLWAVSGIYFIWPDQIAQAVNRISSVSSSLPPSISTQFQRIDRQAALSEMIAQAERASPNSTLYGVEFPQTADKPLVVYMSRAGQGDFDEMDYVYFDPFTGRQLALWHCGVNSTIGSVILSLLAPLHYGTQWGFAVKIVWASCGLALPLLFLTGVLMYWNRTLSKKWRAIGKISSVYPKLAKAQMSIQVRTNERLE